MKNRLKEIGSTIGFFAFGIGASLAGIRGCNMFWNNEILKEPAYTSHSYATGVSGHIEYVKYSDGSSDVRICPDFNRLFDSELHQDLNGDKKIDRIRQIGAELKMNNLNELLVRETDYFIHKERFDEADEQLRKLIRDYD